MNNYLPERDTVGALVHAIPGGISSYTHMFMVDTYRYFIARLYICAVCHISLPAMLQLLKSNC